jgi:polysaccharide export outer membrane protein
MFLGSLAKTKKMAASFIKHFVTCLLCGVILFFGSVSQSEPIPVATADYLIGPGDVLDVSVWKDEALTRSVVVLPDGKITFPLAGDLLAGGRTVAELKQEIASRLERYVPELVLSVEVKQSNSMLIYIIGRVNGPGRQVLNTNVNVLQALAMAGGLNPFASKDKIKVFRNERGETRIIPFRYSEVVDGTNLADNIVLKRGDVIVVP